MSIICKHIVWNNTPSNKDRKINIKSAEIDELGPRIWALTREHDTQTQEVKDRCFLQTLFKGSFSLLGIRDPKCALKISACNIQLFFKIFD